MTECRARWERGVHLCAGSNDNPLPCEIHGCGELSVVDPRGNVITTFYGPCRCPWPEDDPDDPSFDKGEAAG